MVSGTSFYSALYMEVSHMSSWLASKHRGHYNTDTLHAFQRLMLNITTIDMVNTGTHPTCYFAEDYLTLLDGGSLLDYLCHPIPPFHVFHSDTEQISIRFKTNSMYNANGLEFSWYELGKLVQLLRFNCLYFRHIVTW